MTVATVLLSQEAANSWIDYSGRYFKIYVSADGLCRLDYATLVSAGVPINLIDARTVRLFHNGEEQYIHITGVVGTGFTSASSIEFYGRRNRGAADLPFFDAPESQLNSDYSLYTDTSAYFLTWGNTASDKRFAVLADHDFAPYVEQQQDYCISHVRQNFTSRYHRGSSRCRFTSAEGWFDYPFTEEAAVTRRLAVPYFYSAADDSARIEIAVAGTPAAGVESYVPHHLKVDFLGETRIDEHYHGYQFVRKNIGIAAAELTNTIDFVFSANDEASTPDRNAIAYIDIRYPRKMNFGGQHYAEFYLPPNAAADKDYIEISGFADTAAVLYDLTSHERVEMLYDGGVLKALVGNTVVERFLVLVAAAGYKSVDRIAKVGADNKFTDFLHDDFDVDYLIITERRLRAAADEYAAYRNMHGAKALVVDIDELCNQFGYGINKHPAAIRELVRYLHAKNPKPRSMFLIGKAIHNADCRKNAGLYAACLVPSAGFPSSDNVITAGLYGTTFEPLVATGRLAVSKSEDVRHYLQKVREYEGCERAAWMKNVVHFGGGATTGEQTAIAGYLRTYQRIIERPRFGASVSTFLKTSSEPVQITSSDSIRNLINAGVTLMTFFGHGYAAGFDQNIDYPENYENTGRYPFILANSCYVGDIHAASSGTISERWVKAQNKGSVGFLASVGEGSSAFLNIYSEALYKNIANTMYGQPIGFQIVNTIKDIQTDRTDDLDIEVVSHEFTLHGDPLLTLNAFAKPDLVITPPQVELRPFDITTVADSFDVRITVRNVGMAVSDTFGISVTRIYPDGSDTSLTAILPHCYLVDTLTLTLPVHRLKAPGMNRLHIYVDVANQIDEYDETNNQVEMDFYVRTCDVYPIYPYDYAIYPSSTVSLLASSGDPLSGVPVDYIFQIDTTDSYNSPLLRSEVVTGDGGLIAWQVPFPLTENRVYYWRVSVNGQNPTQRVWKESSFIYIDGEEGWSQAHFYQFKHNDFRFLDYNHATREIKFTTIPKQLHVRNTGWYGTDNYMAIGWMLDGGSGNGRGAHSNCGAAPGLLVAVIDDETLLGWPSDIYDYGHRNYPWCFSSSSANYFFSFTCATPATNYTAQLANVRNMINSVPDGHYVIMYTWGNVDIEHWPEEMYAFFEALGSTSVRNVHNGNAYIFFTKKGMPSTTEEIFATSSGQMIDLFKDLRTDYNRGTMKSVVVGPSNTWESLNWSTQTEPADSAVMQVYGLDAAGHETRLLHDILPAETEILNLNDSIDYRTYPNLRLKFFTADEADKTPAKMTKWQLRFRGVPETAIDPASGYFFSADTLSRGDDLVFAIATKNISDYDMDSLVVRYWLQNADNEITPIDTRTLRRHPAHDVLIDTIRYSTLELNGRNSIWVEYNPLNPATNAYFQNEQYHFNNIASQYFYVMGDITNPLLDVSFDGRYIMNGDIVSAKPEIRISLKDENRYLALNDTALFNIFITDLQTGIETPIYFSQLRNSQEDITWIPAELPNNSCKIIYNAVFTQDGNYRLRVKAHDRSENESGKNDYIIDFQVITRSTITNLLNYPNPFSTSTRFVFELTGSQIPDNMMIEIFTVAGKLVKTIYKEDLGDIHIGRNITDYAWDGTDMYGDRLAAGLYFYRVKVEIDGHEIEKRHNESDKYFKCELGKMYIIR